MDKSEQALAENMRVDALTGAFNPKVRINAGSVADLAPVREQWATRDSIPFHTDNRDAALDNGFPGLDIRTFLSGDDSSGRVSVHDVLLQPGAGLPAHRLTECDMFFHVIEGTPRLTVGALTEVTQAMAFGYAPADTTFAMVNDSDQPARILCIYCPAGVELGFAEAHEHWTRTGDTDEATYREILGRYGFRFDLDGPAPNDARVNLPLERMDFSIESIDDFQRLREHWAKRPPVPRLLTDLSDCYRIDKRDGTVRASTRVVLGGEDSRGRGVFFLGELGPGYTAPPHFQPTEEELFFVVDGALNLRCGNQTRTVRKGGFGFAPRGASHGFANPGPDVARVITLNGPAGHERGFQRMAELMHGEYTADDLVGIMASHGWVVHSMKGWGSAGSQAEDYESPYATA